VGWLHDCCFDCFFRAPPVRFERTTCGLEAGVSGRELAVDGHPSGSECCVKKHRFARASGRIQMDKAAPASR
jgi:hypothetical protein